MILFVFAVCFCHTMASHSKCTGKDDTLPEAHLRKFYDPEAKRLPKEFSRILAPESKTWRSPTPDSGHKGMTAWRWLQHFSSAGLESKGISISDAQFSTLASGEIKVSTAFHAVLCMVVL